MINNFKTNIQVNIIQAHFKYFEILQTKAFFA